MFILKRLISYSFNGINISKVCWIIITISAEAFVNYLSAIVENGSKILCIELEGATEEVLSGNNVNHINDTLRFIHKVIGELQR